MMKKLSALAVLSFALPLLAADSTPMLAIPGKVIFESKMDAAPSGPLKAAKGKWEPSEGSLRGAELPADHHGAVLRANQKLGDCIVQVDIMFDGGKSTTLSMNGEKDHMARVSLTPTTASVRRDDSDHEGPDKAITFHAVKAEFKPGTWYTVRMEMVGDTMLGKAGDVVGWGSNELFTKPKANPGVTVAGDGVRFRNFTIWEATKNPEWDSVKAGIKNELSLAPAGATAKGKKKKKAA